MKLVILTALLGFAALSLSSPTQDIGKIDDKEFLSKQLGVLKLFYLIQQPSFNEEFIKIAEEFKIENHADFYKDHQAYKNFMDFYRYEEFLPRGAIFSIFNDKHVEQVKVLFKLFYYAKDYETFYKTSIWARQYFNEGLFLYTFSVAILNRPDTKGVVLPPIYEVYPHYFFNAESLNEVDIYKQTFTGEKIENFEVYANYSGYNLNLNPEQSLSYFTEDIGLNSYYYYFNLFNPFWLSGKKFNLYENRGELYYYYYQQLLSRFYLERLSNGFGEISYFNYDVPFETSFKSSLRYPNGLSFPERPKFAKLHEYFYNYGQKWSFKSKYGYSYSFIKDYERRIVDAIDAGFILKSNGDKYFFSNDKDKYSSKAFNTLGALIANYNHEFAFPQYYGHYEAFSRHLLGYSEQPLEDNKLVPSALEHYETSLRDPAFYQLYKRILLFFQRYKSYLPSYTKEELTFNGVKIEKVNFNRLETYCDYYKAVVSNAVYHTKEEYNKRTFRASIKQKRLNNKDFNYEIEVKSDKDVKATVKIYFGPKYDEYGRSIDIAENRFNFVKLDSFEYNLRSGVNIIKRSSNESRFYTNDLTSSYDLYEAVKKSAEFSTDYVESLYKFPRRLMLPKGSEKGIPLQFYVFIAPYVKGTGNSLDGYPLGYPFDRPIRFEKMFHDVPNSYFYEAKVYHKQYFNKGPFLYNFSVAILNRPDTKGVVLPPIYEVYPHYFFNAESLNEVDIYKQSFTGEKIKNFEVYANYSGYNLNLNPEQSLSYFTEDIGLNSYYYYFNLFNPFWLSGKEFNLYENRGELYYYYYQQLLSRFYLERLSNGFGEISYFNYDVPFETSFKSSLRYPNGLSFPERPKFAKLHEYFYNYGQKWSFKSKYGYSYSFIKDYERRIVDVIDAGFILKSNGDKYFISNDKDKYSTKAFNTLGALIANYNHEFAFPQFYGHYEAFSRHLLGYSEQPLEDNKLVPSALEHYETSLRDPAFYQLYKRILLFFQRYKSYLPSYTKEELTFNGVKIEKVNFNRLETYCDYFKAVVSNAVYHTKEEYNKRTFRASIKQKRLNNKDFNYDIEVKSDKDVKATVKIYFGPKYDEYGRSIDIAENRFNFVKLDSFEYNLRSGVNIIKRSSNESRFYTNDLTSSYDLYEAVKKSAEFSTDYVESLYKFPRRLMLPKGSEKGTPLQFYVFIAPYVKGTGNSLDGYPLGYPFDRPIRFEKMFHDVPNSYSYEAKVYHK